VKAALQALAENDSDDLEAMLADFGTRFLSTLCSQRSLDVYRMVHAASVQFPEAAKLFFRSGPDHSRRSLAPILARQAALRGITLEDPCMAADQFLGMVRGNLHMRVALRVIPRPSRTRFAAMPAMRPMCSRSGCSSPRRARANRASKASGPNRPLLIYPRPIRLRRLRQTPETRRS
jgi:hypothetical protein